MGSFDSVLLIAFGGPTRADEVRPFLDIVTRGRPIPPARLDEVAHHYDLMGGRSPLNELTFLQANALQERLRLEGPPLEVFAGMRNWHPFLHETLERMFAAGKRHAVGLILSAQQTEASWDRYQQDVAGARARLGGAAPEVTFTAPWGDHPLFIRAVTERTAAALAQVPPHERQATQLVFTAHSVPLAAAGDSPYVAQIRAAASRVADSLNHSRWSVAYQSRSGNPRDPWLEPDIGAVVRELAARGVRRMVVSPIGFVCDHVEVLYDLDIEAKAIADAAGVELIRAAAVNDHPRFIEMLAAVVRRTAMG